MKHCCGGCEPLIEGFIEAGFDVLNPVQTSAAGMDPKGLVDKYGGRIVFWGGGVDTQKTLPFGTPDEVRREVERRIGDLGRGGGYILAPVHNVQADVPAENLVAMYRHARVAGEYPLRRFTSYRVAGQ
jgi:uroporphyrinogen-III decarboxylase